MLKNKSLFIFDLDDTLILEQDYVLSGFYAVAEHAASVCKIPKAHVYQFLLFTFAYEGREHIFDKLLRQFPDIASELSVENLVGVYRQHKPDLKFIDGVEQVLRRLREDGKKIAVVTDGLASMQMQKVSALGLDAYVDCIVYCWELQAPKPDPAGFIHAIETMKVKAEDCVIIGDNPVHDIMPGVQLGITTVRVLQGRFRALADLDGFSACYHCASLQAVLEEHYGN